jgi:hypothetical protein
MQIFFRGPHEDWDEQRSVGVDIGQTKKHLSFVRVASAPETIFLRLDPSDRLCEVVFSGELFGAFEIGSEARLAV